MASRRDDIKGLWPDKLLYGAIMLLVTGLIGALHAGFVLAFDVTYSSKVPALLRAWPPAVTLALSAGAAAGGWLAMTRTQSRYAFAGAAAGVASLALLGLGTLFSLVALGFLAASRREGEDASDATRRLDPDAWPDKSLAASLLALMSAFVSIAWGAALLTSTVAFGEVAVAFGALQMLAGLVGIAAAYLLYHQRGAWVGVAAGVLGIAGLGAYVLAPLLSVASLVVLRRAWREDEFAPAPAERALRASTPQPPRP